MKTLAQQYLQECLERFPLKDLSVERNESQDQLFRELGLNIKDFTFEEEDRVAHLLAELHEALPPDIRRLVDEGRLVAAEVGDTVPDAHVVSLGEDNYPVYLQTGLFQLLYSMARPIASAVFRTEGESASTGISTQDLARIMSEISTWLVTTGECTGPKYPVTGHQKFIANILAMRAERFILAHEIGHIMLARQADEAIHLRYQADPHQEEHDADVLALQLTLVACHHRNGDGDPTRILLTYAGSELALQVWSVIEKLHLTQPSPTHPSAQDRISILRSALRENCASEEQYLVITKIADVIGHAFTQACDIAQKAQTASVLPDTQAEDYAKSFKRLLEKCSKGLVPNYIGFRPPAWDLISKGYPQAFRAVFVDVAKELAAASNTSLSASNETEALRLLCLWSQYKQLTSFANLMPEPLKSYYGEALTID